MGRFKTENIQYKDRVQPIESVLADAQYDIMHGDRSSAMHAIICLQDYACVYNDLSLMEEVRILMEKINMPSPYPLPNLSDSAASENNIPLLDGTIKPAVKTKRPVRYMKIKEGYKLKMAQFIDLIYKGGWVESVNNDPLAVSDVNYWFGAIMNGYNFDLQNGALSNLYSSDNWHSLANDIEALSSTEHSNRIKKTIKDR